MRNYWTILLALTGAWGLDRSSAADFKFGAHTLTVPDGFEVELIAGPPLVERPIAADFDEQGRLYVADSSGSNDPPDKQLQEKPHRIVRLEDSNGDGRFDRSTLFADRMTFPEGVLWHDGSLFVGAPPSIWKLTDTNGDGVADERVEWMQGKTLTGCANDIHGPYEGPDGWIYWCKGAFARQTYSRPGQEPFTTRAAHIFRCRQDASGFEPVLTGGMDNPVGVAFTETGERILSSTFLQNPGGGKRDGLIHAIYGGVYGKIHDVIDEHPRTGDVMPVLDHLGPAAPCGLICYGSGEFGSEYHGNLFACLFNLHKVTRHILVPNGATFKTIDSDFVTSDDPDFHPTAVIEDADGSLIVINTGGWYKLCCPTSQLAKPDVLGAIYRVRRKGSHPPADPRGLKLNWEAPDPAALAKLLADPRPAVRKRAIAALAKGGLKSVYSISSEFSNFKSVEAREAAIWALTRIDSQDARQAVRDALTDLDSSIRHIAVQSVSLWRDPQAAPALSRLLEDGDLQVRRCAAEALGRIGNPESVPVLLSEAAKIDPVAVELDSSARILEHSIIFALIEIADRNATRKGLASNNPRAHRAALMALDQMRHGGLRAEDVVPLLGSDEAVLRETANWIVQRHPDWGDALADYFRARLASPNLDSAQIAELEAQVSPQIGSPAIQALLAKALSAPLTSKSARLMILRTMARVSPKSVPAAWPGVVAELLDSEDADLKRACVAAARDFAPSKAPNQHLQSTLEQIFGDEKAPLELRLEAFAARAGRNEIPGGLFQLVLQNVQPAVPWHLRAEATAAIARAKLNRAQFLDLASSICLVGPAELKKLLGVFENCSEEAVGLRLIDKLKTSRALASLRPEYLKACIVKFPESVQKQAAEIIAQLSVNSVQQQKHLDELMTALPRGDVRRGQAVFNSPKVACSSCHTIGYRGGHVGPDLTSVGTVRTERDLLESIVYPSASFVRSFEPMVVQTRGGDEFTGILKKDASDEVVLLTGPEAEVRIARQDIEEMHQGSVSVMPQGLDTQLTRQELADLVAFLKNTRWGAR